MLESGIGNYRFLSNTPPAKNSFYFFAFSTVSKRDDFGINLTKNGSSFGRVAAAASRVVSLGLGGILCPSPRKCPYQLFTPAPQFVRVIVDAHSA
jgi:hypothetical protein